MQTTESPTLQNAVTDNSLENADVGKATRVRYMVLGLTIAMAILLYLDRFAINVVQSTVMNELGFTLTQFNWATSAFFWAYALAQVPTGRLGDYWGGRNTLALFVFSWSIVFGAQAFVLDLNSFIALRLLQGICQAGAYAVAASYLRNWIEPATRGFANSAVSMGGRAGKVLTDVLTPRLALALVPLMGWIGYGADYEPGRWREVFAIYAGVGLVWAWVFWRWFRNSPAEHRGVNAAELRKIQEGNQPTTTVAAPLPLWRVLQNRNVWLLSTIMFFVNVGWIFLAANMSYYLQNFYGWTQVTSGTCTAVCAFCGMAGCLAGGAATDWLTLHYGEYAGRRIPGMIAAGGAGAMYLVALAGDFPVLEVVAFSTAYFLNDFMLGALWSAVQDVGRKNSGAMFGFINMSGNLGAAAFLPVIGMLKDAGSWNTVFLVSAGAFLVSLTLWFFVDPRIKLPDVAASQG